MKNSLFILFIIVLFVSCSRTSPAEQRRAEKHVRDSVALTEQKRSQDYYQTQLEELSPKADSLIRFFKYEKNEKYQDHGFYVVTAMGGQLRLLVRDDGKEPVVAYYNGERREVAGDEVSRLTMTDKDRDKVALAQQLAVTIADINELEKRIQRTSKEIQKYEKRLQNN